MHSSIFIGVVAGAAAAVAASNDLTAVATLSTGCESACTSVLTVYTTTTETVTAYTTTLSLIQGTPVTETVPQTGTCTGSGISTLTITPVDFETASDVISMAMSSCANTCSVDAGAKRNVRRATPTQKARYPRETMDPTVASATCACTTSEETSTITTTTTISTISTYSATVGTTVVATVTVTTTTLSEPTETATLRARLSGCDYLDFNSVSYFDPPLSRTFDPVHAIECINACFANLTTCMTAIYYYTDSDSSSFSGCHFAEDGFDRDHIQCGGYAVAAENNNYQVYVYTPSE